MDLLTRLMELQEHDGAISDDRLRELARERRVPLYRLEGLRGFYPVFRTHPGPATQVKVCRDICCHMQGGADFAGRVRRAIGKNPRVLVEEVSCIGRCDGAPAATVNDIPVRGTTRDIAAYATGARPLPPDEPAPASRVWPTDPYASPQQRYGALTRILKDAAGALQADAQRERILATLKDAGLRGMGGAGFPTGTKWAATRDAPGPAKYVVCNADESEPGTFKDRLILEEMAYLVIEAMILGAWVVGAQQGVIYLRHEYGKERKAVERALADARARGLLGPDILGSGFAFDIRLFISPGSYIMGEETALLEALEDKRGEPRNKPPFPTTHGLNGKPTLINNVETFHAVPALLERGADWWAAQGKRGCKGLKYLAVSGDVARPGVVCVPMGTSVQELLDRCGGVAGGKPLHAFAPGGASSNFLPAAKRDVALDFAALERAGSMLGSGAVIYVAEGRDLVELGANEVRFFRNESCGKCVPCRVGSEKAVRMIDQALAGKPRPGLIPLLQELGSTMTQTSICGLGQVALQPILSVIANFPEEAARRLEAPRQETPRRKPAAVRTASRAAKRAAPAPRKARAKPRRRAAKTRKAPAQAAPRRAAASAKGLGSKGRRSAGRGPKGRA
ncbi:MAG: NADH-ubiquinone oxidoreductase-F iron-sulfur binding region domain-containing protein [SAR324 cluster bacterium]